MDIKTSKIDFHKIKKSEIIKKYSLQSSENEYPVAGEKISAGFPAYTDNFKTDPISIDKTLVNKPESSFIIQVQGESMKDAGIFPNSYIVVDTSIDPKDGNIIVARYFDEFVVKRIYISENEAILKAENSELNFPDIEINKDTDFEVWGVVTGTFFNFAK